MASIGLGYTSWGVPCITENTTVFSDFTSTKPTACPRNNTHQINADAIFPLESIAAGYVQICQGGTANAYFKLQSYEFATSTATAESFEVIFAYPVVPRLMTFRPSTDNIGDSVSIVSSPAKYIGKTTAIGVFNTNILTISSAAISSVSVGQLVTAKSGIVQLQLGEVIAINYETNTLTFGRVLPATVLLNSDLYATTELVTNMKILTTDPIQIGINNLTSNEVPAGQGFTIGYLNSTRTRKNINFTIEYRYGMYTSLTSPIGSAKIASPSYALALCHMANEFRDKKFESTEELRSCVRAYLEERIESFDDKHFLKSTLEEIEPEELFSHLVAKIQS